MTQISNKTTALTARNLVKAFEIVYVDFNPQEVSKNFWRLINKQKFEELLHSDNSFKAMIEDEQQLTDFKNSLLKLKNFCSQDQQHQEISLSIVTKSQHKSWIKSLS